MYRHRWSTTVRSSHQKSLELARNSVADVTVVTFDELVARLTEIHSALSPVSQLPDLPF